MMWFRNLLLLCFIIISNGASMKIKNRIQNGYDAAPGKFKYQVFIREASTHSLVCGGSILNKEYVITAAHCVISNDKLLKAYSIEVLDMTASQPFFYDGYVGLHSVTEIIVHENYNRNDSLLHDIALLKVSPAFDFTTTEPVILPKPGSQIKPSASNPNVEADLSGWGTTAYGYTMNPRTLQVLTVRIVENDVCRMPYLDTQYKIYPTHLCTHVLDKVPRGACSGDSGSPLVVKKNMLVGIVSWSVKHGACGTYPDVYTRVSEYVDWIQKHVKLNEDNDIIKFPDDDIVNKRDI